MNNTVKSIFKWVGIVLCVIVAVLAAVLLYFYTRPNKAVIDGSLALETWYATRDGRHNSNTDLIHWKGNFYLVYASAPWHFASETTTLVLLRSKDARRWEEIARFRNPGEDIRDPKFAPIGNKLFLYFLKNKNFPAAEPYFTMVTASTDGTTWEAYRSAGHDGWLFWRPKSRDGRTWYVAAYWHEHGKAILLKSGDGYRWEKVSGIHEGDFNDETAIEFLPDGRMLATGRLEVAGYYFGDNRGNTLIAVSGPPYTKWTKSHSFVTRLDGPRLFIYRDKLYAVGRYQPGPKGYLFETGSILSKRRTALYAVQEKRLVYLTDLPSAGDTSYAGTVLKGDDLYVSYYTSSISRDYPWVIGMVSASDIMMAKIDMRSVEKLAAAKAGL
jgi:hypothetical protein